MDGKEEQPGQYKLQLSPFERVMIAVFGGGMLAVVGLSIEGAINDARLEERVASVQADVTSLKRKVDQNILPLAEHRLTKLEQEVGEIHDMMEQLKNMIRDNENPDRRNR